MPDLAVGSIQQSLLSEAQFQAVMGSTNWVLANGQGVSGSQYNLITGFTNVPDFRGCFIRMTGGEADLLGVKQDASIGSGDISASAVIGGTSIDVGGLAVSVSGSANQLNDSGLSGQTADTTINADIEITSYQASFFGGGNTYNVLVPTGQPNNGSKTYRATVNHRHTSAISGTLSLSGTAPSTIRTTDSETRDATVIAGEETRPVNIAVNYFIKIN